MAVLGSGEQTARLQQILNEYSDQMMLRRLAAQSPLVPPEGLVGSPVMLAGEAPGAEEVRRLRPFAGPAGAVLDKALKKADIIREWSWVTNVVLYRPPGNRTPYPFEIACSGARLRAEIELVRPTYLVLMGSVAQRGYQYATGHEAPERGTWGLLLLREPDKQSHLVKVLSTWHPAATFHSKQAEAEFEPHLRMITHGN